jgi:SPP1 gp7 family putative phage head morphogenesis protein
MAKKLARVLRKTMNSGAQTVAPTFNMRFDVANPMAVDWANKHAAQLVTDVTERARASIRRVVADGIANGVTPRDTAKIIRATIGLTERDAGAVMAEHLTLLAKNVSADIAADKAERYAAKLIRSRAMTIARTETMRASNEGQKQLWNQAREKGLLSGKEKKVWIASDPCDDCEAVDGEIVGIDEDFSVGDEPPLHPNCRCTIGIVG